jgi:hypothetical protein
MPSQHQSGVSDPPSDRRANRLSTEIIKLGRSGPVASRTVRDAILRSLKGSRKDGLAVSAEPEADIVEREMATP